MVYLSYLSVDPENECACYELFLVANRIRIYKQSLTAVAKQGYLIQACLHCALVL